jgi:hypothetical protein
VLPLDEEAWAGALETAVARRDFLVRAGRRRAAERTTRHSGERLAAAYRLAAARAGESS